MAPMATGAERARGATAPGTRGATPSLGAELLSGGTRRGLPSALSHSPTPSHQLWPGCPTSCCHQGLCGPPWGWLWGGLWDLWGGWFGAGTPWGSVLGGALGDSAGGPASPTVESGEDYVNVLESEESADVSLGEWPVPAGVPPFPPSPCCGPLSECPALFTLHVAAPPSALPPADGSREYVNVSQELPPMARTEPGVCWAGGGDGGAGAAEALGARQGVGGRGDRDSL